MGATKAMVRSIISLTSSLDLSAVKLNGSSSLPLFSAYVLVQRVHSFFHCRRSLL